MPLFDMECSCWLHVIGWRGDVTVGRWTLFASMQVQLAARTPLHCICISDAVLPQSLTSVIRYQRKLCTTWCTHPWAEPGGIGPWRGWLTIVLQCYDTLGWVIWPVKSSPKWPIRCRVGCWTLLYHTLYISHIPHVRHVTALACVWLRN